MEKNVFTEIYGRENVLQRAVFNFFYGIASYPRLVIEVFIRRDMGHRYFSIASVITVALILGVLPIPYYNLLRLYNLINGNFRGVSFWGKFTIWYLFIILFLIYSRQRAKETFTGSNVLDRNLFSKNNGRSLSFFYNLPFFKNRPTAYQIEVFIEPAFFFLIGFVVELLGQPIGMLLMVSAVCYGFSYAAGYKIQNDYFQDLIDMMILSEERINAFVYGLDPKLTRNVHFKNKPSDENLCRKMAPHFFPGKEFNDADFLVT